MFQVQRFLSAVSRMHRSLAVALLLLIAVSYQSALAQILAPTTTPGNAFRAGPKGRVTDAGDGRHFRADGFATLNLDAVPRLPSDAGTRVTKLAQLVVHFRTSKSGPSLQSIEIRNGSTVSWKSEKRLSGDFSDRDVPGSNAFVFGEPGPGKPANSLAGFPFQVGIGTTIRLVVGYPGGFEGIQDAGEFIATNVVMRFEPRPIASSSTVPANSTTSSLGSAPPPATAGAGAVRVAANQVIYAISPTNDLLWYGHTGREDGTFRWSNPAGLKVGNGWDFKQLFAGDDGVIYGINASNDLLWYRHDGHLDGTFRWAASAAKKVGTGWNFKQVFSGGGGVIYAITADNQLLWFRHDGRTDGSFRWAAPADKTVGTGWNFKQIFSGGDGVIYAIADNGDLLWFKHDGRGDGSFRWAAPAGKKVGTGWNFKQVFSSGDGVIYAITADDRLLWFRHDGRADGSFRWAAPAGKQVENGWDVKQIFSGADLRP